MPFVYILRCSDGSLYVGHTNDLANRESVHNAGHGAEYTARRRPVQLLYSEEYNAISDAISRERQLKRWSRQKKDALIRGDTGTLKTLSKRRSR
jgi:putative endonuclease